MPRPRQRSRSVATGSSTPSTAGEVLLKQYDSGGGTPQPAESPAVIVHDPVTAEVEHTMVHVPQLFRDAHTIPLLSFLTRMHFEIVKEALTALTNIAECHEEIRAVVVRHISKHHLLKLTGSSHLEVCATACLY